MTPGKVSRAREIFTEALRHGVAKRAAFVAEACAGDAELQQRVEELLVARERMGDFFEHAREDPTATTAAAVGEGSRPQLYPGERLGDRFVIVQFLASGGMGQVYEVTDEHLQGKHFALKILRPEIAGSPEMRQRFEREVIVACEVSHPNICPTHDLLRLEGPRGLLLCLTMKLLRGESLADRLGRCGKMAVEEALPIVRQMAAGLDAAHAAGVIHRDFKPGNVMLEYRAKQPQVWITDFGVSRIYDSDQTMSPIGQITGTRGYIAPELFEGRSASPRSDVYSFGVAVYEMLTGKHPVDAGGRAAAPSGVVPGTPRVWDRMVLSCLETDQRKRPASAGEALALVEAGDGGRRQRSPTSPRGARLRRVTAILVFLIAGLVGVSRIPLVHSGFTGIWELGKSSHDWLEKGRAYLAQRDRKGAAENAIRLFKQAVAADPQNAAAWAALAEAYGYQNQLSPDPVSLNLAQTSAARALALNPYLAAGHTAQSAAVLAAGKRDEALAEAQRALALNPRDSAANMALGDVYARERNFAEAEQAYREGVELAGNDWYTEARFGLFLYARVRYADAAAVFERARKLDPNNAMVNRNLGATYFNLGRFDEAASAFQRALETNPSAIVYTDLGTLLFYQGRYREAVDAFERAVRLDSNRYRVWANLADAYRWTPGSDRKALEAYQEAIRLLRKAIELAPGDINLTSQLATFLAKSGKKQEALAEISNVHSGQPANVLVRAAMVEELCGNRAEALEWLRAAVREGYSTKELDSEPEFLELRKDPEYHRLTL